MAKTKLFESWTFRLQLPPPFDDPKYSGAKPMGFSQYNTSSTAQKATLHAPTLRALLAYAKLVSATENGQSVDDLGAIGHQGNTYRISEYRSANKTDCVVFNPVTGKFSAVQIEDGSQVLKPYSLGAGNGSGSALLFCLMPVLNEDDEFRQKFQEFTSHYENGWADMDAAFECALVLCDNVYRRIENSKQLGMGTYTDFTGAIRITPCLKEPLAGRFRQFLGIRHMKRDVKILEALFPALEERKAVTLFGDGDFGEDGAFFLPIHTRDLTRRICLHERYAEGLTDERDMNMTPGSCPSLYCDLELRNDPDNGHSYLGWNEAEKAYYITDWIGYIAEWLSKLGYHLDGKMFAVVEGGMSYYTITVDGDKVTSEEFIPDATYVDEFYACEESEDT